MCVYVGISVVDLALLISYFTNKEKKKKKKQDHKSAYRTQQDTKIPYLGSSICLGDTAAYKYIKPTPIRHLHVAPGIGIVPYEEVFKKWSTKTLQMGIESPSTTHAPTSAPLGSTSSPGMYRAPHQVSSLSHRPSAATTGRTQARTSLIPMAYVFSVFPSLLFLPSLTYPKCVLRFFFFPLIGSTKHFTRTSN